MIIQDDVGNPVLNNQGVPIKDHSATPSMTVRQLFMKVIRRLPSFPQEVDFLTATQAAVDVATQILREAYSNLLIEDISIPILANEPTYALDPLFIGFVDFPWIAELKKVIFPIPNIQTKIDYSTPNPPTYYELRGFNLTLWATPALNYTLVGEYYRRPAPLVDMSSTLPFYGLIDNALVDAVAMIGQKGVAVTTDPKGGFREFMRDKMALISHLRPKKSIVFEYPRTGRRKLWLQ